MSYDRTFTEIEAAPLAEEGAGDGGGPDARVESNAAGATAFEPSGGGAAWAWATEHIAPERASTEQLVSWLARGELPPHALVWKPGWGEWLPAMQVAELAAAFPSVTPGSRRRARADNGVTPPPFPVAHYPRLRLLAKDVLAESPLPPFAAGSRSLEPAEAGRRALRDLDHVQHDLVTSQVPAAAMLEAALAMKRSGTRATASSAERWGQMELGALAEAPQQAYTPPPRSLAPLALELGFPALLEPDPSENRRRPSKRYGRWLLLGALVGGALGVLDVPAPRSPIPAALGALRPAVPPALQNVAPAPAPSAMSPALSRTISDTPRALSAAEELTRVAPSGAKKTAGIVQLERKGKPALLHALRAAENDGFDRVVFEFRDRVPGYHLEYVDKPVRGCGDGKVKRIDGDGRLEVRFSPAYAHTERGEPTVREREIRSTLSSIREIEKTCDFEGVVTWVVGTTSRHRYRAYELSAPPRLVVEIDH